MPGQHYVVWNNKGGAGKTTLTFHLSTQYAIDHKDEKVLIIDMCPQANVSSALLSTMAYDGDLQETTDLVQNITESTTPGGHYKSVCGYLMAQINNEPVDSEDFIIPLSTYNRYMEPNMFLLCGDPYLDVISKHLEKERRKGRREWEKVTLFINTFIKDLSKPEAYTVFIDTNPSFSVYTELAISAATRLIVPFNADSFSKIATMSMLRLLYGVQGDKRWRKYHSMDSDEFSSLARSCEMQVPKIHLVIHNRSTPYALRAAKAFAAKASETWKLLKTVSKQPNADEIFVNLEEKSYKQEMGDFHSKAIVCLHQGCPLKKLPTMISMPVEGENEEVKISIKKTEIAECLKTLEEIVKQL